MKGADAIMGRVDLTRMTHIQWLLTTEEVAHYFNMSANTVRNWRNDKNSTKAGPAYIKVGGGVRYKMDDIIDYIKKNTIYVSKKTSMAI